jgi:predicted transcriptional regulator
VISTVRDRIVTEFIQLDINEKVANAYAALKNRTDLVGVVSDEGRPITLVTHTDLEKQQANSPEQRLSDLKSKLPPGIVISPDMTLEAFVNSSEFTALDDGAHGAIVTDQDQVVGILSEDAIDDYLAQEYESVIRTKGDTVLAGSIVTGRVIIYCDEFGHRNEIKNYSRHKVPDCQVTQPYIHPLKRKA